MQIDSPERKVVGTTNQTVQLKFVRREKLKEEKLRGKSYKVPSKMVKFAGNKLC
jgi:hypothetical protein